MSLTFTGRRRSILAAFLAGAALAGCATLPASGPTAGKIEHTAKPGQNDLGYVVRQLTPKVVADAAAARAGLVDGKPTLASLQQEGHNDEVGPGDVLAVSLYEVGVGLFGSRPQAASSAVDPSARAEDFKAVTVDRDGMIYLPYIGKLHVGGKTAPEIQTMIAAAYRGQSQSPQVVVAVRDNVSANVFVSGEVRKPGKVELSLRKERLLDAIALSGGTVTAPEDTVIRFSRGDRVVEERFDHIRTAAIDDLTLVPGDRIEVIRRPRTFLVLGATSKVSQIPFETSDVSLIEAIARVGGPNDNAANASGIFVFRFEPPARPGLPETPVIYRVNMMEPQNYLLAQRFAIQDKDVVYVSNAKANGISKFVSILNQLFSPAFAVAYATKL